MIKKYVCLILILVSVASLCGCSGCATLMGQMDDKTFAYCDIEDLKSECLYAWNPTGNETIYDDIENVSKEPVFFKLHLGDYNFKDNETEDGTNTPRTIWMNEENDKLLPTVTCNDLLIYVSGTQVPEEITFERFADYGYTIGVANLQSDDGGHYYIPYAEQEDDDYKYYINTESDADQLTDFNDIRRLHLDKVGDIKVNTDSVSEGGTVMGLTKGKDYVCEFYTGTYYQDYLLRADIHTFCSFERFISYDFEFLHSNCISITIPEYFVSGYYMVNGLGLFRYVAEEDLELYETGKMKESDYNKPMIIYDENGYVTYDPSDVNDNEPNIDDEDYEGEEDVHKEDLTNDTADSEDITKGGE